MVVIREFNPKTLIIPGRGDQTFLERIDFMIQDLLKCDSQLHLVRGLTSEFKHSHAIATLFISPHDIKVNDQSVSQMIPNSPSSRSQLHHQSFAG